MNRHEFATLLFQVSNLDRDFAERFVHNSLPRSFRYIVSLNESFDGNPLRVDERIYPKDDDARGKAIGPLDATQVVELLWRDSGVVPEWIDISVINADIVFTYFSLLCCGRFTANETLYYYNARGQGPFGIKSPIHPPCWSDDQGRFDLHWRKSAKRI